MRGTGTSARRFGAILPALLLAAGCAPLATPGDRYFAAGDLVPAAAAYRATLEGEERLGEREQRALLRLGLIHLVPEGPLHDPERAGELLGRLVAEHPESVWAAEARLALALEAESRRLRREVGEATAGIEELSAELAAARGESARRETEIAALEEDLSGLRDRARRLAAELAAREKELERLKAIDLE